MQMLPGSQKARLVEAVIFDWGGVFTRRPPGATRRALEKRLGLEPSGLGAFFRGDDWLLHSTGRQAEKEFWERVCAGFPTVPDGLLAARVWEHIFVQPTVRPQLVGIVASLHGRFKVGLLSNAGTELRGRLAPVLAHFDEVVISAEVGCHKPDSEIFELALARLAVKPAATLFVDDYAHNVAAARELGIRAHRFRTPAGLHRWLALQGVLPAAQFALPMPNPSRAMVSVAR
jgi:putative hydrolase of the HAD superfamily